MIHLGLSYPITQGALGEIHFPGDLAHRFIRCKDDADSFGFMLIGKDVTFLL
jgi:hypothetical protein